MAKNTTKFLPVLVIGLLLPQIVLAAWWNPISWFKTKPAIVEQNLEEEQSLQENEPSDSDNPDVVQEKIIERVITVNDPQIQLQVNQLIKENTELKSQLSLQTSLVQQLNQCKLDLSNAKSSGTVTTVSAEYQDKNNKFTQLDEELLPLISEVLDHSEVITPARFKVIVDRTNELITTYKYVDPKSPLKEIPNLLGFMSEGGQLTLKLKAVQPDLLKAYQDLKKTLDWYISYR